MTLKDAMSLEKLGSNFLENLERPKCISSILKQIDIKADIKRGFDPYLACCSFIKWLS